MKKIIFVILIFMSGLPAMSQVSEKSKVSFGFNAGVGQTINGYRLTPDKYNFTYYEGDLHFTSGINVAFFATDKIRPRFEFRYSQMGYGRNWSEVYTDFDKTKTYLNTLNLNFNLDYLMFNKNKFQLFVSPGLVSEFITGDRHKNDLSDGSTNHTNYSVLTAQHPDAIVGANLSLIAKYKINEHLGFTLTPGYNYYLFRNWTLGNEKNYMKTIVSFGVEYTY
jgi:hypothetical protein